MSSFAQQVAVRADFRCEYCKMHQSLQGATFHVEHIRPEAAGGERILENVAWACPGFNLRKSNNTTVMDPITIMQLPLFHPRNDDWREHFVWEGFQLMGLTPVGRAMIAFLDLNSERRIMIRQAESMFGLFPPIA